MGLQLRDDARCRPAVRAKIFQLLGGGALTFPLMAIAFGWDIGALQMAAAAATAGSSLAATYAVNFYGKRDILELSVLEPQRDRVRFSSLDFWGNRLDYDCSLRVVEAPFHGRSAAMARAALSRPSIPWCGRNACLHGQSSCIQPSAGL